jgi:NADH dehydrogenase
MWGEFTGRSVVPATPDLRVLGRAILSRRICSPGYSSRAVLAPLFTAAGQAPQHPQSRADPRRTGPFGRERERENGPASLQGGALSELARFALVHEYRHIDTVKTRIVLLEAGPRILPAFPAALARKAEEELERKGVEVRIDAAATAIDEEGVIVNGGERIRSHNVIWAAGVKGTALGKSLGIETDRMGRVKVLPDLSISDHPEIFVIGKLMVIEQNGKSFSPGLAPVAVQQGQYVGRLIARRASAES